jgi:pSer/pThr/pTyr-binding forkhead associated (FHA) protein
MPVLTLQFKDNPIKKYRFGGKRSLNIGRRENNDIVISNLTVSGNHLKIDYTEDGYLLTDLKSKNGTFVNDESVTTCYMRDGDVISIGKHSLLFNYEEGEEMKTGNPVNNMGTMDRTMAMDTEAHREMVSKAVENADNKSQTGVLAFIEGRDGKIVLSKKLTKIGKDSSCDIIIGGFLMGKIAATLSKSPQGYTLSYVGGMTKPRVNNSIVKNAVTIEEYDVIKIGSVEMQFFYKD